jgi:hypothetical protein
MIRESDSDSNGDEGDNKPTAGKSEKKPSLTSQESYKKVIEITPQLKTYLFITTFFYKSTLLTVLHFRWKIKGRVERISRLIPIKGNSQMFYFGLRDHSGMIRIKAFGQQAQNYFNIIEKDKFYTIQFARVMEAKKTDQIYPLKHEIVLAEKTQVT